MADERFPNDPYRPVSDEEFTRAARRDARLQPDPELEEGSASSWRIAAYAVAIALILAAVFYGLNQSNIHHASTSPPAQTANQSPAPATPKANNTQPGMTTGSANGGAQPASPPSNSGPNPSK